LFLFFSFPFVLFFASCALHCSNRRLIVRSSSDRYQHLFNRLDRAILPLVLPLSRAARKKQKKKMFEHDACEIVLLFDDADRRSNCSEAVTATSHRRKGTVHQCAGRVGKGNEKGAFLCCKEAFLLVEFLREMSRAKKTKREKTRDETEKKKGKGDGCLTRRRGLGHHRESASSSAHQVEHREESDDRGQKRG
jgi:hypothetical protein